MRHAENQENMAICIKKVAHWNRLQGRPVIGKRPNIGLTG